jgi:filamentous hemagglutinin
LAVAVAIWGAKGLGKVSKDHYQATSALVTAWALFMSGVGGAVIAPTAGTAAVIGGGAFGGISDAGKQLLTMKPSDTYSYTDTLIAIGTGALTQGKGLVLSESVNTNGAYLGSKIKGEDATGAVTGAVFGTLIGYKGGEKITEKIISKGVSPITAETAGVVGGGVAGTVIGTGIEAGMKTEEKNNEK